MRYIRWQGALVFVAIVSIVLAFAYLLAGPIAKSVIEKYGAKYTGAEVNVGEVSVQFIPFALVIDNLQATDPKKPENNMVSFEKAAVSVDLWQLVLGRTIIEKLDVNSISFSSKRASKGAVYRIPSEEDSNSGQKAHWFDHVEQQLPDPKVLLDNANLKTVKRAEKLAQTYQQEKETIEHLKQQLPDPEKLKAYQARVKALTQVKVKSLADIEKIKQEFDQLKKEFKQEQAKLKTAKEHLLSAKDRLNADVVALKNAPTEDWQDIASKYQLSTIEAEDFAHLLFGEKARDYYQWAEIILAQVKPLLNKGDDKAISVDNDIVASGRFVHFTEDEPLPSFWLKEGNLSLTLAGAQYQINVKDITHQHWMIDKKSQLNILADNKEKIGALTANAQFAFDNTAVLSALGDWSLKQFPLDNIDIKQSSEFNLQLIHALLQIVGRFTITDNQLAFNSKFGLTENNFVGNADNKMANVIIETLSATDALNLDLTAKGDWLSPSWQVNSELGNLLAGAFKQQVSAKLSNFKQKVQAGLTEKMANSLSLGEDQLGELANLDALIGDSDKAFSDLANSDVVKQQKDKLKDKAKDKLKDKLGKIFG